MAETFSDSGVASGVAAIPPRLSGEYIPAIDNFAFASGLGLIVPWGAGRSIRESMLTSMAASFAGAKSDTSRQLLNIANSVIPAGDIINYYFEGLIGPPGAPGPVGPQGVGVTNYIGGAGIPTTALVSDIPYTNGIGFSDGGGGKVTWTAGSFTYEGVSYSISAEATGDTNKYIYWDKNDSNTTFKTTDTLADVLGADKWIMCYNDAGTPYPAASNKVFHAGIIEASTIDTVHLNASSITTAKINNLDVTTGKINNDAGHLYESATTAGTTTMANSGTMYTIQTITYTSLGGIVNVTGSARFRRISGGSATRTVHLELYQGSTLVDQREIEFTFDNSPLLTVSLSAQSPFSISSGELTFTLKGGYSGGSDGSGYYAEYRTMSINESKGK